MHTLKYIFCERLWGRPSLTTRTAPSHRKGRGRNNLYKETTQT